LLIGGAITLARNVTVQAGNTGTATMGGNTANASTFTGIVTLNHGLAISQVASGSTELSGAINGHTRSLTLQNVAGTAILSGPVDVDTLSVDGTTTTWHSRAMAPR